MKIAYCDCYSGISGDMFLGALLDVGLPLAELEGQIRTIHIHDRYELVSEEVNKNGFRARSFKVNPLPDLAEEDHGHHEHGGEDGSHHHHHHRSYEDIVHLIEESGLKPGVKETSLKIFHVLAEAEAQVHGVAIEDVHFHEVGALDSIIDIVGAAIGLDYFNIQRLYTSALPWSGGEVESEHGKIPLPAPATLQLMKKAKALLSPVNSSSELVTPTGAAILAALATFERPAMVLSDVGVGAGSRDLPWANVFRLILGETVGSTMPCLIQMETNIDDMNPQVYGHIMDRLFSSGALDVFMTPIYMKKNRPATMLGVIASRENETSLAQIILEETSTLGLRVHPIYRYEADREIKEISTRYGPVRMKCKLLDGKIVQTSPEYEDCAKIARELNLPVSTIINTALAAGQQWLDS